MATRSTSSGGSEQPAATHRANISEILEKCKTVKVDTLSWHSAARQMDPTFPSQQREKVLSSDSASRQRSTALGNSEIDGRISKGFFLEDNEWTCYRRNYFSCVSSYSPSLRFQIEPPPQHHEEAGDKDGQENASPSYTRRTGSMRYAERRRRRREELSRWAANDPSTDTNNRYIFADLEPSYTSYTAYCNNYSGSMDSSSWRDTRRNTKDALHEYKYPSTKRPTQARTELVKPESTTAEEEPASKYGIPEAYSLKNWDPTEKPILLLGSVFDANSLGKWIYDWTIYNDGMGTPIADMAGDIWLLLLELTGKIKRSEHARSEEFLFNPNLRDLHNVRLNVDGYSRWRTRGPPDQRLNGKISRSRLLQGAAGDICLRVFEDVRLPGKPPSSQAFLFLYLLGLITFIYRKTIRVVSTKHAFPWTVVVAQLLFSGGASASQDTSLRGLAFTGISAGLSVGADTLGYLQAGKEGWPDIASASLATVGAIAWVFFLPAYIGFFLQLTEEPGMSVADRKKENARVERKRAVFGTAMGGSGSIAGLVLLGKLGAAQTATGSDQSKQWLFVGLFILWVVTVFAVLAAEVLNEYMTPQGTGNNAGSETSPVNTGLGLSSIAVDGGEQGINLEEVNPGEPEANVSSG